jgi:hypothetical protein
VANVTEKVIRTKAQAKTKANEHVKGKAEATANTPGTDQMKVIRMRG